MPLHTAGLKPWLSTSGPQSPLEGRSWSVYKVCIINLIYIIYHIYIIYTISAIKIKFHLQTDKQHLYQRASEKNCCPKRTACQSVNFKLFNCFDLWMETYQNEEIYRAFCSRLGTRLGKLMVRCAKPMVSPRKNDLQIGGGTSMLVYRRVSIVFEHSICGKLLNWETSHSSPGLNTCWLENYVLKMSLHKMNSVDLCRSGII